MRAALDSRLLVVTGKGGVGKTTIAAAVALAAARRGRRALVVELGQERRVAALFGVQAAAAGAETRIEQGLDCLSIDPDRALLEWLQALGGRVPGRMLASSGTFQYFAAAAPGARELVSMMKVWRLTGERSRDGSPRHDLVVLDAPATGHALGLLASPRTFGAIAGVGPIASHTRQVRALLTDPARSSYLAVALPSEMAVTEALELRDGLRAELGRGLDGVVVNALLPRRFTVAELDALEALPPELASAPAVRAAVHAAHAVHARARAQHRQLARLRRRGLDVTGVPFVWGERIDRAALQAIATRLQRAAAREDEASR